MVSDALLLFDFHLRLRPDSSWEEVLFCGVDACIHLPLHKVYNNFYQAVFFYFKPVGFAAVISSERNIFHLIQLFSSAEMFKTAEEMFLHNRTRMAMLMLASPAVVLTQNVKVNL